MGRHATARWRDYQKAVRPHLKVFREKRAEAKKAYDEAVAAADKVYVEATLPFWRIYEEARDKRIIKKEVDL